MKQAMSTNLSSLTINKKGLLDESLINL